MRTLAAGFLVVPCVILGVVALGSISYWRSPRSALAQTTVGAAVAAPTSTCVGDCDRAHSVSVDEIVTLVNIALGDADASACPQGIPTDLSVTVALIIQAVNNALNGCSTPGATHTAAATATPSVATSATLSPSPTSTATPSPSPTSTIPISTPSLTPRPPTPTHTLIPTASVRFCNLPGSVQTTAGGLVVVPGGPANTPDLTFLHLPVGFCAHFFAHVGNARQLRFAPGGELFVASPMTGTTGGGPGGRASIIVLPDDDRDGVVDTPATFLSGLPSTQGLMFTNGYFYYQDRTRIMRVPYASGDRTPSGSSEQVADITIYSSGLHWPKPLDVADDGAIYVGNGGDQGEICTPARPFHGGILKLDGSPGGSLVAKGFRNPISVRCSRGHNLCFAIELAKDFTAAQGGREKLVPIRQDDDWGFPCCATKDLPFQDILGLPNCSTVASENASFFIGDTPFDLDFETGLWPAPWNHRVYVPLHGIAGSWVGARVVAIALDPLTGELLPGSDLDGASSGAMSDFATGWDDGSRSHGRPANVAFATDGRLFLGNDNTGDIVWIAPQGL